MYCRFSDGWFLSLNLAGERGFYRKSGEKTACSWAKPEICPPMLHHEKMNERRLAVI
jgi:hypothetical protein